LNLDWQAQLAVKRSQNQLPSAVSQAAFSAGTLAQGESFVDDVALGKDGSAVFVVTNVQDGKSSGLQAAEKTMMQNYLAQNQGALEYQALTAAAKSDADVEIYR
jgi:hypothetical protein